MPRPPLPQAERERILRLREQGYSYDEILQATGNARSTIGRTCREGGMPAGRPHKRNRVTPQPALIPAPEDPRVTLYRREKAKRQRLGKRVFA